MPPSNKALSVLQKTYDDSYLACSTAVYYEGQGDEAEAMRRWRAALDRIFDHDTNRVLAHYTPTTETERALVDSLRQLELQCKERIDLLEALRLSRHEASLDDSSSAESKPAQPVMESADSQSHAQGWIGGGTIPALEYTELSRPALPPRPSVSTRSSLERIKDRISRSRPVDTAAGSPSGPSSPFQIPQPEETTPRRTSPERHTMRTTLRGNRLGDKSSQSTPRRTPSKPLEGPGASKAATLAWTALARGEKSSQAQSNDLSASQSSSALPSPLERSRRSFENSVRKWDSHSRRLVTPRGESPTKTPDGKSTLNVYGEDDRQTEYRSPAAPSLSISAAANAINSMNMRDGSRRTSLGGEHAARATVLSPTPRTPMVRKEADTEPGGFELSTQKSLSRNTSSDSATIPRRPVGYAAAAKSTTPVGRYSRNNDRSRPVPERGQSQEDRRLSVSSLDEPKPVSRVKSLPRRRPQLQQEAPLVADSPARVSDSSAEDEDSKAADTWKNRKAQILRKLPPGVDEQAAKQILNEIVVHGDEVHWSDVAGLEIAKNALREAVVYPFLRPDLFMGLREPARGMLLFGPPGTGKTMLARAVATESKSTFFSISASSLTSKYLGESEKLVKALFVLAKQLAPSIIFVDEIDSLLSKRSGSGEHEATRRIKTEFLIQWSDLQRAAAGREVGEKEKERGDANRVLVLAATNLPWIIDDAARRRFVRRQYIPLPEAETRTVQIKTLLSQQKHTLTDEDIETLVGLTDGFSGSDITALAKDAAMGPLRSLGEALLHMTMDEIRPIALSDFIASLTTIRPSVSKASLKEYEDWAKEFGERGG
ncbi:P-loop containing nucleoside triphosphate hydrolase protein [Echria macrotheca]|uniref:P-loop containing nucleoside triphosphate hydrolase protein n=1 Tax=Echria macrotheca TaxID=438768 RepID=A0AAJ0BB41_9PEZI|nr:P-loop containing nucleoside triphosphate hydrolase protein [Echria macrotheca]